MKLREDNVLLMLTTRLKNMCNDLGVFIFTATQVNMEYKNVRDADQNLLRGAKSIADKIDVGIVALEPTQADLESLSPELMSRFDCIPNIVFHVYKNRRGKYKSVKVWAYVDLGNCRTTDLFMTDNDYRVIPIEITKIESYLDKEIEKEIKHPF